MRYTFMRTSLFEEHVKLNAKFVDFHGWEMPIQYTSIIEEHKQVRSKAGIFDVSHMGDIVIEGEDAQDFISYLLPSDLSKAEVGKAVYSAYLNSDANMIDDTSAYKMNEERFLVIPNAATTDKIYNWIIKNKKDFKVDITNISNKLSCIALQGPYASEVMKNVMPEANKLDHFTFMNASFKFPSKGLEDYTSVARTGYTGEDGFEFIIPNEHAPKLWEELLKDSNVKPIGLGARDTLRMEKGFLLSGQDFNEDRNPIEAGISWIINWDHEFIGKNILEKKKDNVKERFRGLLSLDKTIPRNGNIIKLNGEEIGKLTSGTFSPSLSKGIGLGYLRADTKLETEVTIVGKMGEGKGIIKKPRLV